MKQETITTQAKGKEIQFTVNVPETTEEFTQVTGVPVLDFANKEFMRRVRENTRGKVKEGKIKPTDKQAIQQNADNFRLRLGNTPSPAKKQLQSLFRGMSEAEALAAAEAVAKLRKNGEATDTPADDQ